VIYFGPALLLVGQTIGFRRLSISWQARRRALGWILRKTRWEFWPPWLAYLPVIPYVLYLGVRHRSLTLFTAANPGIPTGGFAGESKSHILAQLTKVPDFTAIPASLPPGERIQAALQFIRDRALSYPVVLKPDVGERGTGVAIARSEHEIRRYLEHTAGDTIVQKYAAGLEFGVFYYRFPGEPEGHISSITEKRFPQVTGDGRSSLTDLVLRDDRAVCLSNLYLSRLHERIPAAGERVTLAELGSHCRGAIFLNGAHLETAGLRGAIEAVAQSHKGFYFGRFDIRAAAVEDFQAGRFQVLELNGVSAEATHVYDPSVSLLEAYRVMLRHWRMAFEIGAINRDAGAVPTPLRELLRMVRSSRVRSSDDPESARIPDPSTACCLRAAPGRP
jgi:hypothetical protein